MPYTREIYSGLFSFLFWAWRSLPCIPFSLPGKKKRLLQLLLPPPLLLLPLLHHQYHWCKQPFLSDSFPNIFLSFLGSDHLCPTILPFPCSIIHWVILWLLWHFPTRVWLPREMDHMTQALTLDVCKCVTQAQWRGGQMGLWSLQDVVPHNMLRSSKHVPQNMLHHCFKISSSLCCCCSVTKSCPALHDPMNCSMPGFPVFHYLPELAQTHVHWISDAIQPPHPLSSPSPLALNLSQHHGLF